MNVSMIQTYEETKANRAAIAGLRDDLTTFENSVHKDITDLNVTLIKQGNDLRREIGTTAGSLRAGTTNLGNDMIRRFEAADIRLNTVKEEITGLRESVSGLDTRVATLDTKVTSLNTKVTSLDSRLTSLDTKVTSLDTKVTGLNTKVTSLDSRLTSVEQKVSVIDEKVTGFDAKLDTLIGEIRGSKN